MVSQYLMLLLNSIVCKVGGVIDSGFANSISLAVICVFGILASIKNFFEAFYDYGVYYFRMKGERAKGALYLNIIVGILASVIMLIFNQYIRYIFSIEEQYEELLRQCTTVVFIFFPFESASQFIRDYMVYTKQERLCSILNILYYAFMIGFDIIAVIIYSSAILVLIFTGVCNIGFVLVSYKLSGISKEMYTSGDLKEIIVSGFPMFFNRIISHICMLLINVFGSRLGTVYYAILIVSRKAVEFGQQAIRQLYPVAVTKLRGIKSSYKDIMMSIKEVIPIALTVFVLTSTGTVFIVKGDLTIEQVLIPCTLANLTAMVPYLFYLFGEIKMVIEERKSALKTTGIIRFITTIALCFISTSDILGPFILLFYSTISDTIVGLFGYIRMNKTTN